MAVTDARRRLSAVTPSVPGAESTSRGEITGSATSTLSPSGMVDSPSMVSRRLPWNGVRKRTRSERAAPSPATAQEADVLSAQDIRFERITTADGLSNTSVNAVVQDQQGFMWIGTQEGLDKYDGYQFTIYRNSPLDSTTLTHNRIESLLVDHAGTLWIGTADGLNRYDRDHDNFTRYQHDPNDPNSLSDNGIMSLFADRAGMLWISVLGGGLHRLRDPSGAPEPDCGSSS